MSKRWQPNVYQKTLEIKKKHNGEYNVEYATTL